MFLGVLFSSVTFLASTLPLVGEIATDHGINFQCYTDDSQFCMNFNPHPNHQGNMAELESCIMDIKKWILIYLFGVLCRFQHYARHITTGSFEGRGNQYMQLVKVLYSNLTIINKQLQTLPQKSLGFEPLTLEVGGECVTVVPAWPREMDVIQPPKGI